MWLNTSLGSKIPGFYISYRRRGGVENCRSLTAEEIQASQPEDGLTILYSHANAEDLGSIYPWCKFLSKMLRVNLFAYDYSGYGMAYEDGPPSEQHCYADIDAAYSYLRDVLNVPAENIVLYGRSLGSGPSCHLAAQSAILAKKDAEYGSADGPVGGLILHAPFLSVYRVVLDTGCTLYGDKFPNVDIMPMVRSPTILIHGTADQIVPFHHSERMYEAIAKPFRAQPIYIEGMSHNNVHSQVRPLFVNKLAEYLQDHVWPNVVVRGQNPIKRNLPRRSQVWKILDSDERDSEEEPLKSSKGL